MNTVSEKTEKRVEPPESKPGAKPKKRYFYLDFIRALSVLVIVLTHFNNPYLSSGGYLITNQPFGVYVGSLGVSLFLIISGTALSFTYKRPLDFKKFYKKRFLGIYPMFWMAWVIGTLSLFVIHNGVPLNAAPARTFVFTFFAIDGLVANFGVQTMYLLGEWFLGFIVLFYIVFPLLLWAVQRFPVVTAIAGLAIYAGTWYFLRSTPHSFPNGVILPLRLPELLFGIYFGSFFREGKVHPLLVFPAAAVLGLSTAFPNFDEDIALTWVGIAAFIILAVVARYVDFNIVKVPINLISKYSYAIFLVHHVVIMELYFHLDWKDFVPLQRWMMLAVVCVLTYVLAVGLYHSHEVVMRYVFKALERPQREAANSVENESNPKALDEPETGNLAALTDEAVTQPTGNNETVEKTD